MSQLRVPVSARDHIRGGNDADVTLVEYGDYQCPYCAMANPIVGLMERQYGRALRVVFRHFPMEEVHPLALTAAEAAEYAGDNGVFWEMHDAIYANQPRLGVPLLFAIAGTLKLSQIGLRDSLASFLHAERVRSDFLGGVRSGVNGTPTFFINGVRHDGGFSASELSAALEQQLTVTR
ncbi:DsbA family protein [Mycoplana dimorpha]|uniref:Protein-disulfide isomerase n=1 Tax=Mycoplana dimorpha TaxID=28320 RepID=A0A2T5B2Z2_MYCDI|nr:DsbA family protein [Mycoplana dimorpha]PTM93357.1 protein-disulfide isomerase [Mycoplana dimorpha]